MITENNFDIVAGIDRFVDLYEVRIDLIGDGWQEWVRRLRRPWIACNRLRAEGGNWSGNEITRLDKLFEAIKLGASIVDIELKTPELAHITGEMKKDRVECLISAHNLYETPAIYYLDEIVNAQKAAGAGICKVVTTAQRFEDNFTILQLLGRYPDTRLIAFAMGEVGVVSRVMSGMYGGYFTYASVTEKAAATCPGQLGAAYMRSVYEAIKKNHR